MCVVNSDRLHDTNIQSLNNKWLYLKGEDLIALKEKWHNYEERIIINEVKDTV